MLQPTNPPLATRSPASRFLQSYWTIGRTLSDHLDPMLQRRYGINVRDYMVLATIHHGVHYPTELATTLRIPKDMASRLIQKLLQAGLIERAIDEKDSRRTRLEVTTKGHEQQVGIKTTIDSTIDNLLEHLGQEQSEHLLNSLEAFSNLIVATLGVENTSGIKKTTDL